MKYCGILLISMDDCFYEECQYDRLVDSKVSHWPIHGISNPGFIYVVGLTLKTNISRLKKATVLKLPSQMLGLPVGK